MWFGTVTLLPFVLLIFCQRMPTNETSKSPQQRTANNAAVSPTRHTRYDELQEGDRSGNGEGEEDFEGTNGYLQNSSLSIEGELKRLYPVDR